MGRAPSSGGRQLRQCLPYRKLQLVDDLIELRGSGVVWWCDDDRVAGHTIDVATHGIADEAIVERSAADPLVEPKSRSKWPLACPVGDKLQADEKTTTSDVAKSVEVVETLLPAGHEPGAVLGHSFHQPVPDHA